jgi:hypothetical protein
MRIAHSIEDDVEDVCVHTDDEILCLKTIVKIRKRAYKEITPIPEIYDDEIATLNELLSKETIQTFIIFQYYHHLVHYVLVNLLIKTNGLII